MPLLPESGKRKVTIKAQAKQTAKLIASPTMTLMALTMPAFATDKSMPALNTSASAIETRAIACASAMAYVDGFALSVATSSRI